MEIQTKQIPTRTVISISRQVYLKELSSFIRSALDLLEHTIVEAGVEMLAAPMAIYHEQLSDEQRGLVEVCWPIAGDLHAPDGVELKQQPATEVAYIVVSLGESADIGTKYDAVFSWIGHQGRTVAGPPRENYLAKRDTIGANDPYIEIDVPSA